MRISRPCYDKFWRCPGWAGAGWTFPQRDTCANGSGAEVINWDRLPYWQMWRCPDCGMRVLPAVIRNIDPSHWWFMMKGKFRGR